MFHPFFCLLVSIQTIYLGCDRFHNLLERDTGLALNIVTGIIRSLELLLTWVIQCEGCTLICTDFLATHMTFELCLEVAFYNTAAKRMRMR